MNMARLYILFLLLMGVSTLNAQEDTELKNLMAIVESLRQTDVSKQKTAYGHALQRMKQDKAWTPMDELVNKGARGRECRPTDRNLRWFKLNNLLNTIMQQRQGLNTSRGDMLNGADPNFNYSLLEKGVKGESKVTYELTGRQGKQLFVLMTFNKEDAANLSVSLKDDKGKSLATGKREKDGNVYLRVSRKVEARQKLTLDIQNKGKASVAVVIINHNTRK